MRAGGFVRSLLTAVTAVCLAIAWAMNSPVGASPDEPTHVVHSWAVATGQTSPATERVVVDGRGVHLTMVETPAALQEYQDIACYLLDTGATPSCGFVTQDGDGRTVTLPSYMTRYPPLYYAGAGAVLRAGLAVGLTGHESMLAARVASGVVSLSLVLFAGWVLRRRFEGPGPALALVAGLTPVSMTLFSAVNPNGLEIGAAVLGAALVVAVREDRARDGRVRGGLLLGLAGALGVLTWTRPLSLLWAGLLLVVLLLPGGVVPDLVGRGAALRHRLPSIAAIGGIILLLASAAAWVLWAAQTRTVGEEDNNISWSEVPPDVRAVLVVLKFGGLAQQMVGLVGSDTSLPLGLVLAWLLITTAALVALATGSRDASTNLSHVAVFAAGAVLVVAGYSLLTAFGWQGRYWLPAIAAALVLAVPSLQGRALRAQRAWRTTAIAVLLLLCLQLTAFVWHLWRYVYGVESQYNRFDAVPAPDDQVGWLPPLPLGWTAFLLVTGTAALVYAILGPVATHRVAQSYADAPGKVDAEDLSGP